MHSKVVNTYDICYVAGYDKTGDILYIDRRVPKYITTRNGGKLDVYKYLELHETVEAAIEHHLGLKYQESHKMATDLERQALERDGFNWKEYSKVIEALYETCRKDFKDVPPDLDLQPYVDMKDKEILAKLAKLGIKP